jgi:hypothetical protein
MTNIAISGNKTLPERIRRAKIDGMSPPTDVAGDAAQLCRCRYSFITPFVLVPRAASDEEPSAVVCRVVGMPAPVSSRCLI